MIDAAAVRGKLLVRRPWWQRALRWVAWGLIAVWSLLLIAWLTLHWGILTHIERWRPELEQRASAAIGATVRIGHIEARSGSWVPAFEFRDVVVLDAQQRVAVRLPRVALALSPRSLLAFEPRLSQLLIDGAQLDVRRDLAGDYFVGGLPIGAASSAAGDGDAAAKWFFKQYEFVIRGGTLRWTDERRAAPPLALADVTLVVRNGLRRHDLRFDATPPPEWGDRLSIKGRFNQPLLSRGDDWRRWSGQVEADLPRADVRELRRYLSLPFELSGGQGALQAWLELKSGEPTELTLDLALRDVSMRLASAAQPLVFTQAEGRIVATRGPDGVSIEAQRFGFATGDGLQWPRGNVRAAWRQRQDTVGAQSVGAPVTGGDFTADRLDLALMAAVAARVPLGDSPRQMLAELAPQGIVSGLQAHWDGPLSAPTRYDLQARLAGFGIAAKPAGEGHRIGRPGLRNAGIDFSANERGGTAQVAMNDGAVTLPGVFEEPLLPIDQLSAQVAWRIDAAAEGRAAPIEVKVRDARFANADAQGSLEATWRSGADDVVVKGRRNAGRLELEGQLDKGQASRVARYLPLALPANVRHYVGNAVTSGNVTGASFRVKGDLADFPFAETKKGQAPGEFRIAARVDDVGFAYVPGQPATPTAAAEAPAWPPFEHVSAELVFDRTSMLIRDVRAKVYGVDLAPVQAGIANLMHSVLTVDGTARGPMSDLLRFAANSPVVGFTHGQLTAITASGPGELHLGLEIPLDRLLDSVVKGSVTLTGNDVKLRPDVPSLGAATGRVDFSEKGFAVVGAKARLVGGEATFDGGTQPDGNLRFNGAGTVLVDALRHAPELGAAAKLTASMSGQARYALALGFVGGRPEFTFTSDLVGLALDVPAPLRKAADAPMPLRVRSSLVPESLVAGQVPRDTLDLELGSLVRANYQRDVSRDVPQVLRGGIGIGEPAPVPARGVQANVSLPSLDVDAWLNTVRGWSPPPSGGETAQLSAGDYLPTVAAVRVQDQFTVASRSLTHFMAGASLDDGAWRVNVDADQVNGYAEYRAPRSGSAPGRVYARLARLVLPKTEAEGVEQLLDRQPASVPALDIVIEDFQLRGKRLGRLDAMAVNSAGGREAGHESAREWRLTHFGLSNPDAQLSGSGTWAAAGPEPGARRRAAMDFKLDMSDGGALLERLGLGKTLADGKGRLAGQVSWLGSPLSPDVASMSGKFDLTMASGRFLKVDAGAAKLLGVLSLQSLPRRLMLDFRDVFDQGFPFDSVAGDVVIANGLATTNNLRMRGVQAAVLMEGSADLGHETQDLRVVVVPEINAGTASLAYAAINPAIGLGTFLAQMFLRKPIMRASTREFRITGGWSDPEVERIERKFDDPIPDFDVETPAAAASSGVGEVPLEAPANPPPETAQGEPPNMQQNNAPAGRKP